MEQDKLLTGDEMEVVRLLAEAWNKYTELEVAHEADRGEFARYLHAAQNIVLSRPAWRELVKESRGTTEKHSC